MHRPLFFDPPWVDFFKKPCPYFISRRDKFTLFPNLPKELQKMIWEEAFCDRRQIFIQKVDGPEDEELPLGTTLRPGATRRKKKILQSSAKIPAILHVNYDARQAGLKIYQLAFAAQLGHPVYINFDRDLLVFPSVHTACLMKKLTPKFGVSPTHMNSVQYVWMTNAHITAGGFLTCACHHFNALKHLLVTGDFRYDSPWHYPGPRPVIRPPPKGYREAMKLQIFPPDRAPKDWEPPEVTTGNLVQWDNVMLSETGMGWVLGEEDTWGVTLPSTMDWEASTVFPSFEFTNLYGRAIRR